MTGFFLPEKLKKYEIQDFIAYGTYGYVYRAVGKEDRTSVVLKFGSERDMRKDYSLLKNEAHILQGLMHENIVRLIDFSIVSDRESDPALSVLVLENCLCDFWQIIDWFQYLDAPEIKTISAQMLRSLEYLENCKVLHCDVKPANLLLSSEGKLKLCDFGLSRPCGFYEGRLGFNLFYSPPEALLGVKKLDYTVDAWSAGCIIAEFYNGAQLFEDTGLTNESLKFVKEQQLARIFELCGSYTDDAWKAFVPFLPAKYQEYKFENQTSVLEFELEEFIDDELARDLISQLLVTDSKCRLTSKQALDLPYFQSYRDAEQSLTDLVKRVKEELTRENSGSFQ